MPFDFKIIEGVLVVLERNSSNQMVGVLTKNGQGFHFNYDADYLISKKAIPLGPEMPLTRKSFSSKHLFRPFFERIPSKENPAYSEYCKAAGISVDEDNPLILLTSIASRGPSSFLFKPIYNENFLSSDLKEFRNSLGLSVREFAACFDFSQPGITRAETGKTDGRDILKRVEIYALYPNVALDQLRRRGGHLHKDKLEYAKTVLQKKLQ